MRKPCKTGRAEKRQSEQQELTVLQERIRQLTDECEALKRENSQMRRQLNIIFAAAFGA